MRIGEDGLGGDGKVGVGKEGVGKGRNGAHESNDEDDIDDGDDYVGAEVQDTVGFQDGEDVVEEAGATVKSTLGDDLLTRFLIGGPVGLLLTGLERKGAKIG